LRRIAVRQLVPFETLCSCPPNGLPVRYYDRVTCSPPRNHGRSLWGDMLPKPIKGYGHLWVRRSPY